MNPISFHQPKETLRCFLCRFSQLCSLKFISLANSHAWKTVIHVPRLPASSHTHTHTHTYIRVSNWYFVTPLATLAHPFTRMTFVARPGAPSEGFATCCTKGRSRGLPRTPTRPPLAASSCCPSTRGPVASGHSGWPAPTPACGSGLTSALPRVQSSPHHCVVTVLLIESCVRQTQSTGQLSSV